MTRSAVGWIGLVAVVWTAAAPSAFAQPLGVASGVVKKTTPNVLIILPRGPSGKVEKALTLKVRGTSRITTLGSQTRDKTKVAVQRETEAKTLQPNQPIGVIYVILDDEAILLSAVAEPVGGK